MRTLTNQILRELIDHIDVYEVEGRGKNRTQRMVIYYKFVGYLEIPPTSPRRTTRPISGRAWRWSTSPVSRRGTRVRWWTRTSRLRKSNKKPEQDETCSGDRNNI